MTATALKTQPEQQPAHSPTVGALMPKARLDAVRKLAATARQANQTIAEAHAETEKAFVIAAGVGAIREAISGEILNDILQLANTPLGFKTDRPPGAKDRNGNQMKPYPDAVYKDVLTEALIRGLRVIGNEINIIAGNLYVTKEGLRRLIREFPGLRNFDSRIGVPKMVNEVNAVVPCKASWMLDGKPDSIECEGDYAIPIRVNKAMGTDAVIGKAESKLWKRVYEKLTGSEFDLSSDAEAELPSESK